jgi:hypothetical protein
MNADHIALLESLVAVADKVIEPPPMVRVPERTLRDLREQLERARREPDTIVGDETLLLVQTLEHIVAHRADGNEERALRWCYIAGAFLAFIRTDVANSTVTA